MILLEDLSNGGLVLHQVLAISEQDDAVLLLARELQLLLDDGEHLGHLEGAGHEELGVGHVTELGQSALVLCTFDYQGELIRVLLSRLSCPLATFIYREDEVSIGGVITEVVFFHQFTPGSMRVQTGFPSVVRNVAKQLDTYRESTWL